MLAGRIACVNQVERRRSASFASIRSGSGWRGCREGTLDRARVRVHREVRVDFAAGLICLKVRAGAGWHNASMVNAALIKGLLFDSDLIRRYGRFGPRYSPYLTADCLTEVNSHGNDRLNGCKGLVVRIVNEETRAWSAAKHLREARAEQAITYNNDKAKPFVTPLSERIACPPLLLPCNVSVPGQLEAVFAEIGQRWGQLDFLFHSIASAHKEDLHGRLTDWRVSPRRCSCLATR